MPKNVWKLTIDCRFEHKGSLSPVHGIPIDPPSSDSEDIDNDEDDVTDSAGEGDLADDHDESEHTTMDIEGRSSHGGSVHCLPSSMT